jgi:hypothetical protein
MAEIITLVLHLSKRSDNPTTNIKHEEWTNQPRVEIFRFSARSISNHSTTAVRFHQLPGPVLIIH